MADDDRSHRPRYSHLLIGTTLAHFQITTKLGEGGMGEVYRARDTKLERDVAIKVLPAAFTEDPDRLERFKREARLLAQLHHPNIASIFGLEESSGVRGLVMELVEGPTLAERLVQGPLPVEEILSIARQIAEALEAAHEEGIIHRDLKPQNVKVTADGRVKVLDFGLAKAMDRADGGATADLAASPTLLDSPTLTGPHGTRLGVILGTAAYMAPEQARGGAVDKRVDIWAFGVVLYEMLCGRSPFAAETVSDILAGVLRADIDLDRLPGPTPPAMRRLLRRCLERNPKNRLHDIADARIVLAEVEAGVADEAPAVAAAPAGRNWRELAVWGLAIAAMLTVGALLLGRAAVEPAPPRVIRATLPLPPGVSIELDGLRAGMPALSPDGRRIAFGAREGAGPLRIWVQDLATAVARPLPGTEEGHRPFWSPDGATIGFFTWGTLATIPAEGGAVRRLAVARDARGGTWSPNGTIVFAPFMVGPLMAVSELGGEAVPVTGTPEAIGTPGILSGAGGLALSPDGRWAASSRVDEGTSEADIWLYDLVRGSESRLARHGADDSNPIFAADSSALYFASAVGERDTLVVRRELGSGAESTIFSGSGFHRFAPLQITPDGAEILYQEVHRDRSSDLAMRPLLGAGETRVVAGTQADELHAGISPDGRWLVWASDESGRYEIYAAAFPGGESRVQVSRDGGTQPRWHPKGGELFYKRPDNTLTVVPIEASSGTLAVGAPQALFPITDYDSWTYAVAGDGERFLVREPLAEHDASPITLLTDWASLVGRR